MVLFIDPYEVRHHGKLKKVSKALPVLLPKGFNARRPALIAFSLSVKIEDMEQEIKNKKCGSMNRGDASAGAVYGLGVIGAAVYFIQHADSFLLGVFGILKALVWPAFLAYKLFQYFGF